MTHWRFIAQLERARIFRLEDVGRDSRQAAAAAAEITGLPTGWTHVAAATERPENTGHKDERPRTPTEILDAWSPAERQAFADLCAGLAPACGYETPVSAQMEFIPLLDRPRGLPAAIHWRARRDDSRLADGKPRLCVWGTGEAGLRVWETLSTLGGEMPAAFVDSDPAKQGRCFLRVPVVAPDELRDHPADRVLVASMFRSEIDQQLARLGVSADRIIRPDLWTPRMGLAREVAAVLGMPPVDGQMIFAPEPAPPDHHE
jgi:hypothetical protein